MNAVSLDQTERIWLNAYLPGVPSDIDAGIEDYPSLREVFLEHLHKYRDRVAYVSIGTEMTYATWQAQGIAFAAWLQAQGVRKGDRVALMMPNCLQYPICLLGTILAGAVVVNVNPLYTSHELKHLLKDSGAETVVIFENFAHTLEKVVAGSTIKRVVIAAIGDLLGTFKGAAMNFILRRVQKQVPAFNLPGALRFNQTLKQGRGLTHTPVPLAREELAFLQYTGGTTGDAKGVMLSHRNIIANLLQAKAWVGDQLDQNQQETNVTLLPLYHIFSLTVNCLMFMCLGGRNILIANPRDVKRVQMILRKERFNGIAGVNTLFNGLLENAEFRARDFSDLRLVIAGGMATHTAVAKRWKEVTGLPIIEGYGLTECSPVVSISPIDISRMRDMEFTGSIGVPLPSTWVRFIREDGEVADIGEQGELQVRGPQVMQGYWQRPKETAEVLDAEGWLSTGDIGVMNEQGFIRLVDRKKDMILVSGFNVYPNEIEDVVALHPGVAEVAAIGVEDGVTGEKVKIVVVRRDPSLTQEQLLAHCREYLTGYKVPKFVEFRVEELPKTTVGKVLRRALR
ncbi:AMP-binding protein [Pseudomonas sp. WS 5111]|jgi:long-chain acyl-CoA synthetase|uniref:AMP-binding protein n=1 Tax=unclassified Pseudomonas TaxID=196821 RepID=UPI0014728BBC|nr:MULTISPECIES: AMP-binding protein [unclassified Pseudomonas]NMX70129.1 AMP-binding protein [Pseudomonas sp. WS 5111]NMX89049.1 AMP-binding protein [Pseudomonas sp. WS 5010]NMY25633.1 AMP-binding protein [Pseudomonas sp. WS 5021]